MTLICYTNVYTITLVNYLPSFLIHVWMNSNAEGMLDLIIHLFAFFFSFLCEKKKERSFFNLEVRLKYHHL